MQLNDVKKSVCRELAEEEILQVAGGEEEIVVTGYRENNLYLLDLIRADYGYTSYTSFFDGGGGGGGGGEPVPNDDVDGDGQPDPDIVVTGERMTDAQKLSWDIAHARAANEMWLVGAFGVGILAYFGGASRAAGVLAAEGGYVIGTALDAETIEQLTNDLAEAYYLEDGMDGTYDGVSDADRYAPYPY
jgi:hypothetical protein